MTNEAAERPGPPKQPPVLTLDEAGVERLAAAIANVGGYEGDLDGSLIVTFEEERAGRLASAIVEALRRD